MNKGRKGKFITVEGQDGAGKTTNIDYIHDLLKQKNIHVLMTREPGGTKLGEELRRLILNAHDIDIDDVTELLLMFAARAQHITEITIKRGNENYVGRESYSFIIRHNPLLSR